MAKGVKQTPAGFGTYRERQSPTVQAMRMDEAGSFGNKEFKAGDFLVKDPTDGSLEIVDGETFVGKYELRKATWSRKSKKAKADGQGAGEGTEVGTEQTQVAEAVQ